MEPFNTLLILPESCFYSNVLLVLASERKRQEDGSRPSAVEKSMKRRTEWKRSGEEGGSMSKETVKEPMGKVTVIPEAVAWTSLLPSIS